MGRRSHDVYASGADFNEEQDVQRLECDGFHGEEIAGEQCVFVVVQKREPVGRAFPDWNGQNSMTSQNLPDSLMANVAPQLLQLTFDFVVAPLIFACQTED